MDEMQNCNEIRELIDEKIARKALLDQAQEERLSAHLVECQACRAFKSETSDLLKMAAAMPQFDVPEELTQKILAAAEIEAAARKPQWQTIAAVSVLVLGFIAVLCLDSFESVWGMMSWLLCVPVMFALQALIAAPAQGREHVHR